MTEASVAERARAVQMHLEGFYGLETGPNVTAFVRAAEPGRRESLLVKNGLEGLEMALLLPEADANEGESLDRYLQVVEGVSHFVYVAERARVELPATELELELQAEVDKFVLLAFDGDAFARERANQVHRALYEDVRFLHETSSVRGERYRVANALAARFWSRLVERPSPRAGSAHAMRTELRRFYRAGQADKIRLASAA